MVDPLLVAYLGFGLAGAFLVRRWITHHDLGAIGPLDGFRLRRSRAGLFERRLHPAWKKATERVILTDVEESSGPQASLRGRAGRLSVQLDGFVEDGQPGARLVISDFGHGLPELLLRCRTPLEPRSEADEIATGDAAFDGEVRVQGHAPLALALLDTETRPRLAQLLRGELWIVGQGTMKVSATFDAGVLEVRIDRRDLVARAEKLSDQLAGALAAVLDVARRLVAPGDVVERLAENLRVEPETAVRLRIVDALGKLAPHPAARKALRAACQDRSSAVRLQAAVALGEKGDKTLSALVFRSQDDAVAARAVALLGERLPVAQVEAALGRALEAGHGETARACLEALVQRGRPKSENLLLRALASADAETALAAARALGRVGTAAAVAALRAETSIWRPELRSAARQAIAEIQQRLTGAQAGQLSLAGSEAGALSLAQNELGSLSLAETEPGQLSPSQTDATEAAPESSGRKEGREWT